MRALLILAVLLPLMIGSAWAFSRRILAAGRHRRRVDELEAENRRLDDLIQSTSKSRIDNAWCPECHPQERHRAG